MIDIPMPCDKKLFPYQSKGVEFLLKTKKSYLTDEMGLGKTIQVIAFTNLISPSKILIVCPASLKFNWEIEFYNFSTNKYKIQIIKSNQTKIRDNSNILIVSYGTIANGISKYREIDFDLIVLDESHYIKNTSAKRTRAIVTLDSEYKIALTGTPILNRPGEIYATVNWLDPTVLGNMHRFLSRYCSLMVLNTNTMMMMESWRGAHHVEELSNILFERIMLRRRKSEVLQQLPPKTRQIIAVEGLKREAQKRHENLFEEFLKMKNVILGLNKKKEQSQEFLSQLAFERQKVALEKVAYCSKYIIDLLESRRKIVIFAHHREVIKNLKEYLEKKKVNVVQYIGGMNDYEKNRAVDQFQNNQEVNVFIGSIRAAGMGITLTATDLVLFLELDYTPAIMLQAEDRIHRIGQNKNVLIQYFVFKNGIDSMIARLLVGKLNINNRLLRDNKTIF